MSFNRFRISPGLVLHQSYVGDFTELACTGISSGTEEFESILGGDQLPWMVPINVGVGGDLVEGRLVMQWTFNLYLLVALLAFGPEAAVHRLNRRLDKVLDGLGFGLNLNL